MERTTILRGTALAALALVGLTAVGVLLTARAQADDCRSRGEWTCLPGADRSRALSPPVPPAEARG